MADHKTIQECCKDAMLHMAREKDKLRAMLQTLKGRKELHLDENGIDGLRYLLEDVADAMDCMLIGQCAVAVVNAGDGHDVARQTGPVTDYAAVPGRDC